jgi:transcriptional regulator with XRE-family HTH domain
MAKPHAKLSDQIRQAIVDSGETRYRISKATGINEAAQSKFVHGERGLSLESLDALAEYLHLEIVMRKPSKGRGE